MVYLTKKYSVTKERIRQILAKSLRNLCHPSRWKMIYYGHKGLKTRRRMNGLAVKKNTSLDAIEKKLEKREAQLT